MKLLFVTFLLIMSASIPYADPILISYRTQVEAIYKEEVDRAMKFAPEGKSIYQLRGDAQKQAEKLFQTAALLYDIPIYPIGGINWNLRDERAGAATMCIDGPPYKIAMNEILFLRNYDEMLAQTLVHEVAHIITCMKYPELATKADFIPHGPEWSGIMEALGGRPEEFHTMDILPISLYIMRVDVMLLEIIVEDQ